MNDYPKKLADLAEALSSLSEQDRIEMLLDFASKYKVVPAEIAKPPYPEENKVPFCESNAYVWSQLDSEGKLKLHFAVENPQGLSARALTVILSKTLAGELPEAIINIPADIITNIFSKNLSIRKKLGLTGILQRVQLEAKKYLK
jgi:sulfur transfer protein SufE